jgi:hypothetical protein
MIGAITAGLFGTGVAASTNSYESIATATVGSGGSAYVEFTSIPSTYKHLQVRMFGFSADSTIISLNGDTTNSNYYHHWLYGNGASAAAGATQTRYLPIVSSASTTIPTAAIIDFLDYANTNKNKTIRSLDGYDANGSGYVSLESELWMNTAAISTIRFTPGTGGWTNYTSIALYGIKG